MEAADRRDQPVRADLLRLVVAVFNLEGKVVPRHEGDFAEEVFFDRVADRIHDLRHDRGDDHILDFTAVKAVFTEKLGGEEPHLVGGDVPVGYQPERAREPFPVEYPEFHVGVADIDCKQHPVSSVLRARPA